MTRPLVSVIIPNFNRRDDLARTLDGLFQSGYEPLQTIVVDNGSTDNSVSFIKDTHKNVEIVQLPDNRGVGARDVGIQRAKGVFILMLDSDSHPGKGAIDNMIRHFENDNELGAAAFRNVLPNEGHIAESAGSYNVFIGCGVGFRTALLKKIGGYAKDYHNYVDEYDVSYRIIRAGAKVRYFSDLEVVHYKSPAGRNPGRTLYFLVRNNIRLYTRYFPTGHAIKTLRWVLFRYYKIAKTQNVLPDFIRGISNGMAHAMYQVLFSPKLPLAAFSQVVPELFCRDRIASIANIHGVKRAALWGIGKDFAPMVNAAKAAGISIIGAFANSGQPYFAKDRDVWGVPVLDESCLDNLGDATLIIASSSPGETENEQAYLKKIGYKNKLIALFTYDEP